MKRTLLLALAAALAALAAACRGGDPVRFTVLQWNIWQEGTVVEGGYDALVDEIARLRPDFVTLSEVRNYGGTRFSERIVRSLAERGVRYYSFLSDDSGLLSRHPIADSATVYPLADDHGSIYRLTASVAGRPVAVYTAHLDYLDCAYYNVRGYDGSTWRRIEPETSVEEILRMNTASRRDDAIRAFLRQAREDEAQGYAVVLGGDFNEPSHLDWTPETVGLCDRQGVCVPWTVSTLLAEAGYADAYRTVHPDPLTHPGHTYPSDNASIAPERLTWAPEADERERIDFVHYKGEGLRAVEAKVYGPQGSVVRGRRAEERTADEFLAPESAVWPTDHKGVWVLFEMR